MSEVANTVDGVPERFVPHESEGSLTAAEHLSRYWWASQLAPGRRVLDAGCGMGYGSAMLAAGGAREVVGIDVAEAVVELASEQAGETLRFQPADLRSLPFEDASFDLVVCFEVIEHIDDREAALDEIVRVLAPDGVLAISSPNRDVYEPGNPHHVYEYVPEELRAALARRLEHVELRRQHGWVAAAVLDDEQAAASDLEVLAPVRVAGAEGREPGTERFTLALASRAPLPAVDGAVVLTGTTELRRWLDLWHDQQEVLRGQHEHFHRLRSDEQELRLAHRALRDAEKALAVIPSLQLERDEARRDVEVVSDRNRQLEQDVADLIAELEEARAELRRVYASASWRATVPLRRAKHLRGG